ncbi:melanocortin receptor 5-like [Neocloeon triangulifer]|uniref:melanocortin receptor 5-like n=1 Tax=Neocloeon triangulifer TaxID=2078957 RepID=UPI00286F85F9|nr:melanocortin receptor 5-like [Neocloeon triangulifer]
MQVNSSADEPGRVNQSGGLVATNTTGSNDTETSSDPTDALIRNLYLLSIPPILLFCFATFVVNSVVVVSSRWIRRPLSPTISISISLAMADAYASLVVGIGLVINSLLPVAFHIPVGPSTICYVLALEAFRLGGIISSIAHLTALAINHYIGILRPLHYASTMTPRTTSIVIALLWIVPIAFFFIYFSSMPDMGFRSNNCASFTFLLYKEFRYLFSSMFFTPLIIMGVIYCHIFVIVKRHQASRRRFQNSNQLARSVKAVKTTVLILGTYVVGWMPAVLVYCLVCADCLYHFTAADRITMFVLYTTVNFMYILKTLVDPIIYAARMHEIKLALKKMRVSICGGVEQQDTRPSSELSQQRLSTYASRRTPERHGMTANGSFRSTKLVPVSSTSNRAITMVPAKSIFRSNEDIQANSSLV